MNILKKTMDNQTLGTLQNTLKEILQQVVKVCDNNDLDYFLIGGTLLGAVRHKDMIPWDDDIDIAMPRKDYNRFLEIAQEQLGEKYFVHSFRSDKNYWMTFAKVRKNGTFFAEKRMHMVDGGHRGIFIDIFPYDDALEVSSLKRNLNIFLLNKVIRPIFWYKRGFFKGRSSLQMKVIGFLLKPISKSFFLKLMNNLAENECIDNAQYFTSLSQGYYNKIAVSKSMFYPLVSLPLGDKFYNVPKEYDLLLKITYGDYMVIPSEDKRITHSPISINFGE